jgi:hypothetical protein
MSTLYELSGLKRGRAILQAVHQVIAKELRPTPETVHAELPEARFEGFNADPPGQDEIDAAMALIEEQAEQHAASLDQQSPQEAVIDPAEPERMDTTASADTSSSSPDEARENLRQAHIRIANASAALTTAVNRQAIARSRLSDAVQAWQTGKPKITRDELMRDYIRSEQAKKLAIAEGRLSPREAPRIGPSVIDRVAAAQRGGPAAWGNFRRNGSLVKGGLNFDPRKGPVAKLPSQR